MRQTVGRVRRILQTDSRSAASRVALGAAGIVAAVYLLISGLLLIVVSHNLTATIDQRLGTALAHLQRGEPVPAGGSHLGPYQDAEGRRYGPPILVWGVLPTGEVVTPIAQTAILPIDYRHVADAQTISVSGTDVRVIGGPVPLPGSPGWLIVGQASTAVTQAQHTVLLAETLIGPPLLLVVFAGALTIGRRAAAPIERARRRQLDFTADASHELRTPLAVIEAEATLALSQPRGAESYRTTIVRVDAESKRLRRLVDDLLWLSRLDAAPNPPGAEPVDLGVAAEGAVERHGGVAERRSLQVTLHATGPSMVVAPPQWIDRLLGVLLDNACRYCKEGGAVSVRVSTAGSRVQLTIDDDGPGIAPEERNRIFDRFHRASATQGGAGLGLAIGDAIVRATGGQWVIRSGPAGGASMGVNWPHAGH
jgi:signal transduction histidine kinase